MSSSGQSIQPQTRHAFSFPPDSLFGRREGPVVDDDLESHEPLLEAVFQEGMLGFSVIRASGNEAVDPLRYNDFGVISGDCTQSLSFDIPPGERSVDSNLRKVIGGRSLRSDWDGR